LVFPRLIKIRRIKSHWGIPIYSDPAKGRYRIFRGGGRKVRPTSSCDGKPTLEVIDGYDRLIIRYVEDDE